MLLKFADYNTTSSCFLAESGVVLKCLFNTNTSPGLLPLNDRVLGTFTSYSCAIHAEETRYIHLVLNMFQYVAVISYLPNRLVIFIEGPRKSAFHPPLSYLL